VTDGLQFGNREISLWDFTRLVQIAGSVGEQDSEPDEIFLRFDKETYSRSEVMELCAIFARIRPDECDCDGADLRLWWD
jgi:hypothetical protein